jgi:hypothetical protein
MIVESWQQGRHIGGRKPAENFIKYDSGRRKRPIASKRREKP